MRVGIFCVALAVGLLATLALSAGAAEGPAAGADELAASARAALDSWKYEDASEALAGLAKAAPADSRLAELRIEFLARIGRFDDVATLAAAADPALAGKLPVDVALRVGRSLLAAGQEAAAREWILAAARRAGPGQAERCMDSLAALLLARGGAGVVSRSFAAELSSSEKDRAAAAETYQRILKALEGEVLDGAVGAHLKLARDAALIRRDELRGGGGDGADAAVGKGLPPGLLWQSRVGVDEQPERAALGDGLVVLSCRAAGQGLPGLPLCDRLRAFDLRTGEQRWSLELFPRTEDDAGDQGAALPGAAAYAARGAGLAVGGGRVFVLVRTEKFERRGASRSGSVSATSLLALDLATGRRLWAGEAPRTVDRMHLIDNRLVLTGFRNLVGCSALDGTLLWSQELDRALSGDGAVAAGALVLPGWRELASIDPASGKARWAAPRTGGNAAVVKTLVSDGALVAVGESEPGADTIRLIDGASGKEAWVRSLAVPKSGGEMGLALSGSMLVASRGPALRGMSLRDGNAAWRMLLPSPAGQVDARLARAGANVLWCAGDAMALLNPASGKPMWWCFATAPGLRPLELPGHANADVALVLAGSGSMTLGAWRATALDAGELEARRGAGRKLVAVAGRLAEGGDLRAARRLLEIARGSAAPGVMEVEIAAMRQDMLKDRQGEVFPDHGLLVCSLAAAAGGAQKAAAADLARQILDRAGAPEEDKCLAAAGLVILGDEAGAGFLAANAASWAGKAERRSPVLWAARAAGERATGLLLAGLAAGDGPARAEIVEQLAAHKSPEVRAGIERALADPDRDVRMAAAGSLVAAAGKDAVAPLEGAYGREQDHLVRGRLRELLAALGHRPEPVAAPRQPPPPGWRPENPVAPPAAPAGVTREQALGNLAKDGKVLWSKTDAAAPSLTWISVEKKFVSLHNDDDKTLIGFGDFVKLIGRSDVTVAELAFGADTVWAATDRGAFCYDRRTRAWSQIVINLDMDLVDAHVERVELTEQGVAFTVKGRGRFAFDSRARKWSKL